MGRLKMLPPRVATRGAAPKQPGWSAQRTTSSCSRGYGYAWQRLREQILQRDFGMCVPCKARGLTKIANAVDHIVPKFEGGRDDEPNLQSICDDCHKAKTAEEAKRSRGLFR